jgi:hypothetical protein
MNGYGRLNHHSRSNQSTYQFYLICIVLSILRSRSTLAFKVRSSLVFHNNLSSTLRRLEEEQRLGTLSLDGISSGASFRVLRKEEDPLHYRGPSGPRRRLSESVQRRIRTYAQIADCTTLCRGPSAPPQRAPPGGSFPCLAPKSATT